MRLTPIICACTAALLLCSCRTDLPDAATDGPDSLYTAAHIEKTALDQPEEALALLDEAEEQRLRSTIDFLGLWESINNPQSVIDHFRHTAVKQTITKLHRQQTEQYAGIRISPNAPQEVLWQGQPAAITFPPG